MAKSEQILVRYSDGADAQRLYAWLEEHGYRNTQHLTAENYKFPAICVDESGEFFGTNVTCMAAAASCGRKAIGVDEFIATHHNSNLNQ